MRSLMSAGSEKSVIRFIFRSNYRFECLSTRKKYKHSTKSNVFRRQISYFKRSQHYNEVIENARRMFEMAGFGNEI